MAKMKAKPSASRRTKNRIKEHDLEFNPDLTHHDIMGYEGRTMIHAKCVDPKCPAFGTPWIGWLPLDELTPF